VFGSRHISQLSRTIFIYNGAAKHTTTASSQIRADWVHDKVATDYSTLHTRLSHKERVNSSHSTEMRVLWLQSSQPGNTIKPGVFSRQCLPFTITRTMATVSKEGTSFANIRSHACTCQHCNLFPSQCAQFNYSLPTSAEVSELWGHKIDS
jgi:hypothetical protein